MTTGYNECATELQKFIELVRTRGFEKIETTTSVDGNVETFTIKTTMRDRTKR